MSRRASNVKQPLTCPFKSPFAQPTYQQNRMDPRLSLSVLEKMIFLKNSILKQAQTGKCFAESCENICITSHDALHAQATLARCSVVKFTGIYQHFRSEALRLIFCCSFVTLKISQFLA